MRCEKQEDSKIKSITHDTRFKWFPQYEGCPLAEAFKKKFTMKMNYKIVERISLRTQSPNSPKFRYHTIEIIPQKTEIQTLLLLKTDDG
jgi:rubredoxin